LEETIEAYVGLQGDLGGAQGNGKQNNKKEPGAEMTGSLSDTKGHDPFRDSDLRQRPPIPLCLLSPSLPALIDKVQTQYLKGANARRGTDLNLVSLALADQGTSDRRADRYLSVLGLGLMIADDLVNGLLARVSISQGDRGPENDLVSRELGDFDDLGPSQLIL
jgi:hypothetical protein